MGNTFPKLYQIIKIEYNNGPNITHGKTITSFDVYFKAIEWFLHHMNGLILLRRIEHFSKWVKLVALLDKSSYNTS
jgi:DNA-binding LytR/AlgR family response regulator